MILRGSFVWRLPLFSFNIPPKALSSWRISDLYSLLIAESLPLFLFEAPFFSTDNRIIKFFHSLIIGLSRRGNGIIFP